MNNNYQAYLIRFQRRSEANTWRATLENAHSGEIIQFATEKDLLLFLLRRLSTPRSGENLEKQRG